METQIVTDAIPIEVVRLIASQQFGDLVKAVVDVESGIMALGGELHSDQEALMIERSSVQASLWGINLYPEAFGAEGFIEFDSMINVRPGQGNRSRDVEDATVRAKIRSIVETLVVPDA